MRPFFPICVLLWALFYFHCCPQNNHPPVEAPTAIVQDDTTKLADTTSRSDDLLAADGSLDSLLQILYGNCDPVVDTTFQWPSDIVWDDREVNGKWYSRFSNSADGFSLKIEEVRQYDPRPRGIGRDESERTSLEINGRKFRLGELFFTNTRDTVDDVLDFSRGWEKVALNRNVFFYNNLMVPGCNGSGCLWVCTAIVDVNGPRPELYLFERLGWNTELKDIDCDGKLELIDANFGPDEHPYFSDTVHLSLHPYEWRPGVGFRPMLSSGGKTRFAKILMVNGIFEPRQARILRKNWPN